MKNIYIYCEGQTEESFIDNVLFPYLLNLGIYVRPIVCQTKRTQARKYKGGVNSYIKIRTELSILCKQHRNEIITTMFDYYGMPNDTPGITKLTRGLYKKVVSIEKAIEADIGMRNLFFNLTVHEFEGLLFTDTSAFQIITDNNTIICLQDIRKGFASPEHINNSNDTAPSKRLESLIPGYSKVLNGTALSKRIGIDSMIAECEHFRNWIRKIKAISEI